MTDLDLAELKRLEAAATPGPWDWFSVINKSADKDFILSFRNAAPALIAAAEERDYLDRAQKISHNLAMDNGAALITANARIAELAAALIDERGWLADRIGWCIKVYGATDGAVAEAQKRLELIDAALASKPGADVETGT